MNRMGEDARRLWDAAQALNRRAAAVSPAAKRLPPLLFFTDGGRTPRPWETAARLPRGSALVFRGFGAPDAEDVARELRAVTAGLGVRLLVGADAALAQGVGADGLHLPARLASSAGAIRAAHPDWLLTAAVHDAETMPGGLDLDAVIASPVFPTLSASARSVLGLEGLARIVARGMPTYALGGIDAVTADALSDSGVCGLAAVGAIQDAFAS